MAFHECAYMIPAEFARKPKHLADYILSSSRLQVVRIRAAYVVWGAAKATAKTSGTTVVFEFFDDRTSRVRLLMQDHRLKRMLNETGELGLGRGVLAHER